MRTRFDNFTDCERSGMDCIIEAKDSHITATELLEIVKTSKDATEAAYRGYFFGYTVSNLEAMRHNEKPKQDEGKRTTDIVLFIRWKNQVCEAIETESRIMRNCLVESVTLADNTKGTLIQIPIGQTGLEYIAPDKWNSSPISELSDKWTVDPRELPLIADRAKMPLIPAIPVTMKSETNKDYQLIRSLPAHRVSWTERTDTHINLLVECSM